MRKEFVLLVVLLLGIVAALIAVERLFSPSFQQCVAEDSSGQGIVTSYVKCTGEFLDASEGSITALATILIAAFTGTLWVATSTQAKLTREAFIADKRAFVFASGVQSLYEADVASGHFNSRIGPVWQNSGDTPTRGLKIYTDGVLANVPLPQSFNFNQINPAVPPGAGMLGPKMSSFGGQAPHFPAPGLTPQDIIDIQNGRKYFYLWGWAKYRDGLPGTPEYVTRYCWRIICAGNPHVFKPLVDANSVRFLNLYESRGNCADEECVLQGLG